MYKFYSVIFLEKNIIKGNSSLIGLKNNILKLKKVIMARLIKNLLLITIYNV